MGVRDTLVPAPKVVAHVVIGPEYLSYHVLDVARRQLSKKGGELEISLRANLERTNSNAGAARKNMKTDDSDVRTAKIEGYDVVNWECATYLKPNAIAGILPGRGIS